MAIGGRARYLHIRSRPSRSLAPSLRQRKQQRRPVRELAYLLVFVLKHGGAGAAVATVLANGVEPVILYAGRGESLGLLRAGRTQLRELR